MTFLRNKFVWALALMAAFVFFSLSLGGEILHQAIHHHKSVASQQDCPIVQLLTQAFLFVIALALAFETKVFIPFVSSSVVVFHEKYFLPSPRAPPVSL